MWYILNVKVTYLTNFYPVHATAVSEELFCLKIVNKKIFQWFYFVLSLLCCDAFLILLQCAECTVSGTHAVLMDRTDMHSFLSFLLLFCEYRVKIIIPLKTYLQQINYWVNKQTYVSDSLFFHCYYKLT